MSSNDATIADNAGEFDDWIEIFNAGSNSIDLQSYFLSDDSSNPQKWEVSQSVTIQSGGYIIFWADEDQSQGSTHTNFKISNSGEPISLASPTGLILDQIDVPSLDDDFSFGRLTDGGNSLDILIPPSPGYTNNNSSATTLKPVISLASGEYSGTKSVSISAEPTATIYYTTDGSTPSTSSQVYNSPITINSSGSIRAIAKKPGFDISFATTHAYIFNYNSTLPIFFISMDPDDLWSDQDGIYVTGTNGTLGFCDTTTPRNYNQDWEKPAHLKVFVNGSLVTENNIGVKIGGNCKRRKPQKPLDLLFRDEYSDTGDNEFNYKLFPDNERSEFKRLIIRDGNNNIPELFKDAMISRMVRQEFDIDATSAQPAVIFLNGEYIGIQVIREKWDKWHLEDDHKKVQDRDSIDVIKNPGRISGNFWALERATSGDSVSWHEFVNDAKSRNINVESDYQALKAQIDYDEMINYLTTAHFFGNNDWVPNNQRTWKEKGDDNKWRWLLVDMDNSIKIGNVSTDQLDSKVFRYDENDELFGSNIAYTKMFQHEEFRSEYIQRMNTYIELVFTNAKFDPVINSFFNELLPELPDANALYNHTISNYNNEIADQKNYVTQRGSYVKEHIESQFNVSGKYNLSFDVDGSSNGSIALHSNYFKVPNNYSGQYHDNVLIHIHAVADPGFRFSHWAETGNTNSNLYTSYTSNTTLTPIFVAAEDILINEIHYNPAGSNESAEFIEIYNPNNVSLDLSSYEFTDGICFIFPPNTSIEGGEYILIAHDPSIYAGNGYQVFQWEDSKLNNDGEHISLENAVGQIIDSLTYNDANGWISTADNGFYSLALLDHSLDNSVGTSWDVQSLYITPGAVNQFLPFDTYHGASNLVINEIHYNPLDSIGPGGDTISSKNYEFIEIKNISNNAVSLTGVALSRGVTYEFPNGFSIPANGFTVIAEDSIQFIERYGISPDGEYSGKLSNNGELIWLSNSIGNLHDAVRYDIAFPWDPATNSGLFDFSLALIDPTRANDIHINWKRQCTAQLTPFQENDFACFTGLNYDGLMINEIHYNPSLGADYEYIEIVNHSNNTLLNLRELKVTGGISFTFENDLFIPGSIATPDNHIVLARNASIFENTYGFTPDGVYNGGLSNAGETIVLIDFFDKEIDRVTYDDIAPWAVLADQGMHSLGLIDSNLDNNLGSSWCTQDVNLTPKALNSFSDSDFDTVIDCLDECPNFNDAVIGLPCDDGDPCTTSETYDNTCGCTGGVFEDSDNDGICDALDVCAGYNDNIDLNNNGTPDGCEECQDYIVDMSNAIVVSDTSARIAVQSNGKIINGHQIDYHAGQSVELLPYFEVALNSTFHAYISPCH